MRPPLLIFAVIRKSPNEPSKLERLAARNGSRKPPPNLRETIFDYLPPPVSMTPVIEELARKYLNGEITGRDYAAMQAAAFMRPKSQEYHENRRHTFRLRAAEAKADGFCIPDVFRKLVETDAYVDRLHHNCIWLQMPEELWRLPSDPSRVVFLAFIEDQGCCNWHLFVGARRIALHGILRTSLWGSVMLAAPLCSRLQQMEGGTARRLHAPLQRPGLFAGLWPGLIGFGIFTAWQPSRAFGGGEDGRGCLAV